MDLLSPELVADPHFLDRVTPDYRRIAANELARSLQPSLGL